MARSAPRRGTVASALGIAGGLGLASLLGSLFAAAAWGSQAQSSPRGAPRASTFLEAKRHS